MEERRYQYAKKEVEETKYWGSKSGEVMDLINRRHG